NKYGNYIFSAAFSVIAYFNSIFGSLPWSYGYAGIFIPCQVSRWRPCNFGYIRRYDRNKLDTLPYINRFIFSCINRRNRINSYGYIAGIAEAIFFVCTNYLVGSGFLWSSSGVGNCSIAQPG